MFRRIASVAILLMLILSFTMGSTGYATAYQTVTTKTFMDKPGKPFPGFFPGVTYAAMGVAAEGPYQDAVSVGYTTMVVDMGSIKYEPGTVTVTEYVDGQSVVDGQSGVVTGPAPYHDDRAEAGKVFSGGALTGRMLLFKPGNASPDTFPLRWEADGSQDHEKRAKFIANMNFKPDDLGLPNDSGIIVFKSSMVLNGSAVGSLEAVEADTLYTNNIGAGDDNWHAVDVSSAIESLNVDLNWEDADGDLRLMIYAPDGSVLGPYTDSSDGATDGRINLNIAKSEGLAAGEWYLKVSDLGATGTDDYYIKTY